MDIADLDAILVDYSRAIAHGIEVGLRRPDLLGRDGDGLRLCCRAAGGRKFYRLSVFTAKRLDRVVGSAVRAQHLIPPLQSRLRGRKPVQDSSDKGLAVDFLRGGADPDIGTVR